MRLSQWAQMCLFVLALGRAGAQTARSVSVEENVRLEVLDWGGTGGPLVLLTGLGSDAHVYDRLAAQLTVQFHVYAVTRRGFGNSSKPAATVANYSAERLGEDVLAVLDALKLKRPILAGHSIAGEELSWIGSRHPERVAGLVYLDAGDGYGLYDPVQGDWQIDMNDLKSQMDAMQATGVVDKGKLAAMMTSLKQLEKSLRQVQEQWALMPGSPPPLPPVPLAIRFGEEKFTRVHDPVLAIFACPHDDGPMFREDPKGAAAMKVVDQRHCTAQVKAFKAAIPQAKVIVLPGANHFVFVSNGAEVVRAVKAFGASLR